MWSLCVCSVVTVCEMWSLCVQCDHCMYNAITVCALWSRYAQYGHCVCNVITPCAMWSLYVQCDHCMCNAITVCSFWSLCVQSDHCMCKSITVRAMCSLRMITVCAPRWLTLAPIPAGPASDSWWSRPSGPGATEPPTFPTSSDNPVSMILTHRPTVAESGEPSRAVRVAQHRSTGPACLSCAKEDENSVQTYSCVASVVVCQNRTLPCLFFP